jgi:flagellar motor switch protein FliN/FliY
MSDISEIASSASPDNGGLDMENIQEAIQPRPFHDPFDDKRTSVVGAIDTLLDVTLQLTVELGNTQMTVRQVLDLQKGSVVELNRIAGDSVDVFVNGRLIARGEVVVVDDKFGVRVTELVASVSEGGEG